MALDVLLGSDFLAFGPFFEWRSCWVVKLTVFSFLDFSTTYYEDMGCIPPLGE